MYVTALCFMFVGFVCGTVLVELKMDMYINATLKCEAHKKCETLMASFTSWLPKGEGNPQSRVSLITSKMNDQKLCAPKGGGRRGERVWV